LRPLFILKFRRDAIFIEKILMKDSSSVGAKYMPFPRELEKIILGLLAINITSLWD
jgi:hypothetical protein